jgi:hypothetical protein
MKIENQESLNQSELGNEIKTDVSDSVTTEKTTTDTTIWKGDYVTDNFYSYYLDENMVKHYR